MLLVGVLGVGVGFCVGVIYAEEVLLHQREEDLKKSHPYGWRFELEYVPDFAAEK